jgi:Ribbon-helix-helix domain
MSPFMAQWAAIRSKDDQETFAETTLKSSVAKRSVIIAGQKTSVSLEDPFWKDFKGNRVRSTSDEIAYVQRATLLSRRSTGRASTTTCPPRCAYSYRIKCRLLFGNKAVLKQQTKSKIDFWMPPMFTGCFFHRSR